MRHQILPKTLAISGSVGILLVSLTGAMLAVAQQSAQEQNIATVLPPTAEGDWVRVDKAGSGRWDALTAGFPQAVLTPEGAAMVQGGGRGRGGPGGGRGGAGGRGPGTPDTGPHQAGQPYVVYAKPCSFTGGGQTTLEYDSEGFHMVLGKDEALIVQERGGSRRIYLDGRGLPDQSVRTPTPSGYSVGHIEADGTLVVDTTDMTPGGVTAGGYRTPETHLIQRYIPSADGKHLTYRLEWNDPKIYQKPHVYEFYFDRMAPDSYALETFCDATDPLEGQSIVPPSQQ